MNKKIQPKNKYLNSTIKIFSQAHRHKNYKKYNNYTVNSNLNNRNLLSKEALEIKSKEIHNVLKTNQNINKNKDKNRRIRTSHKPASKTVNHKKKIYIKLQQKKDILEDNVILDNVAYNENKKKINNNKNDKKILKNNSKIPKTYKKLKININRINTTNNTMKNLNCETIFIKKNKNTKITEKNEKKSKSVKNKNNSDIINRTFGDSSIEVNKPKKAENNIFNNTLGRKSNATRPCTNHLMEKFSLNKNIEENKIINKKENKIEIKTKILMNNIIENEDEKNNKKNDNNMKTKNQLKDDNTDDFSFLEYNDYKYSDNDSNEIDKFFKVENRNTITNNNDLFRISNISIYNNNDLFYLNNKNLLNNDNSSKNKNSSYFINPKNEKVEEENNMLLDFISDYNFEDEIKEKKKKTSKKKKDSKDNNILCTNCGKLINLKEIDEHSNNCFRIKESKKEFSKNYISIIDNKIKIVYEHLINIENHKIFIDENNSEKEYLDLILILKQNTEQILNQKIINSSTIEKLSKINIIFDGLMKKYFNSSNIFSLLRRIKSLLEEKINYFVEHNNENISKDDKKSKKTEEVTKDKKILRNTVNPSINNKNFYLCQDKSMDEALSESETMEFFDLKKIEQLLDEKRELKSDSLNDFVNEAKNKRLFLMEVLKVKYQKINNNKNENLITPIMIWNEAKKKNITKSNWSKFIFDELNNPKKYLKLIQKEKDKKNENKKEN